LKDINKVKKCAFILTLVLSLSCLSSATVTATIYEPPKRPKIISFNASSTSVELGETVVLSWYVVNATSIEITGLEKQEEDSLPLNGSLEVWPLETTSYTLTATSDGGSATASITVKVDGSQDVSNVYIDSFTTSQSMITLGSTVELTWKTNNAKTVTIIGLEKQEEDLSFPLSGSLEVFPTATTTYILIAVGSNYELIYDVVTVIVKPNWEPEPESPLKMNMSIHDWNSEYIIDFDIINQSDKDIKDWTLTVKKSEFDLKFIWAASATEDGEFIIISPLYYNNIIDAGGYVSFGLQGYGSPSADFYYKFNYK